MTGGIKKILKKLVCTGIVILALLECAGEATTVTTLYEFIPEQSTVVQAGGLFGTYKSYTIEGQFQLTVDFDADVAWFDHVDATYGDERSLGDRFNMTELESTYVSYTAIDFEGQTKDVQFDIHLGLAFVDDSVHLTGGYIENVPDGYGYDLDAVAVPEPCSLILFVVGLPLANYINRRRRDASIYEGVTNALVGNEGSKMTAKGKKTLKKLVCSGKIICKCCIR